MILHYARRTFRQIARAPGFFATVLAVLALGLGSTTAMFALVESLLLRPLAYPRPSELTMVWAVQPRVDPSPVSLPDFADWKAGASSFRTLAALKVDAYTLTSEGAPAENLRGASVSGEFFPTFELAPLHGRLLGPDDDRVGAPRTCVLSSAVFQRRFGGDRGIVGRTITLDGQPHTVVGIAAEGFRFGGPYTDHVDVWTPLAVSFDAYALSMVSGRGNHFLHVVGRRKAGVALDAAGDELARIASALRVANPDTNASVGVRVQDLHEALVGSSKAGMWILFVAVGLVFLVVCANVGNLLLSRAEARRGEMAIRAAIGASARDLATQTVVETVVVFVIGSALGALLARTLVDTFAGQLLDTAGAYTIDVRLDGIAVVFAALLATIAGGAFGLVPALATARTEPHAVLKRVAARAGTSKATSVARGVLVVGQVALATALLVTSGLALRAFASLAATPTGFDPDDAVTTRVFLPTPKYADDAATVRFYERLAEQLRAEPGVVAVGGDSTLPFSGSNSNGSFRIEGRPDFPPGNRPLLARNVVVPGYFEAMRIPVLRGRSLTDADRADGKPVMVVSQSVVDHFFAGEDPIGKRIDWRDRDDEVPMFREIVGVVADVLRRDLELPAENEAYVPLAQDPSRWMVMVARTKPGASAALVRRMPELVARIDPDQAPAGTKLLSERVADAIGNRRTTTVLLGAFAVSALVLASLGLFGLVSYTTAHRTNEIGLRMALGARPESVVALVCLSGARLLGIGLAVGLLGALAAGPLVAARIHGARSFDPIVFVAVPLVLAASAVLASLVPALRAVRVEPSVALGYE